MAEKLSTLIAVALFATASLAASAPAVAAKAGTTPVQDKTIEAFIDQTEVLHLPRPAGSLIIGNPNVANVAVHDDRTLLITGKQFGATNLIVLDNIGRTIHRAQIQVGENRAGDSLTIARGDSTETLSCTTRCRPVRSGIEDN